MNSKKSKTSNPKSGMKEYTINVHFDMVVTETVIAEDLDEAKEKAETLAAERNLSKYGDCAGVDSCLVSEKEID